MTGLVSFTHWVKISCQLYRGVTFWIESVRAHQSGTLNVEPLNLVNFDEQAAYDL